MRSILLLPLLLLLTSCGAMQAMFQDRQVGKDLGELSGRVDGFFGQVDEKLDEVRTEVVGTIQSVAEREAQARQQADADGNGLLEGGENLQYLLLLLAGGAAELQRRKNKDLNARIDHEREKRKDAEVARLKELVGVEDEA